MTFDLQTLAERVATLDREISSIDLPALQAAHDKAAADVEANRARLTTPNPHIAVEVAQVQWQELCNSLKSAVRWLEEAKARRDRLTKDRAYWDRLLRHDETAATARQHHAEAVSRRDAAAAALAEAEGTLSTIKDMIRAEREADANATKSAAARLLAMVKAGTKSPTLEVASSGRLSALELSQATAESEVQQARQNLGAAEREVAQLADRILKAEASGAELQYLAAEEAYTLALSRFVVLHYRAHRFPFEPPDHRTHARKAMADAGF